MPEAIGYGSSTPFLPRAGESTPQRTAQQVRELETRQEQSVAETVQRQANSSSRRAESLERVAEQLENRSASRPAPSDTSLGGRIDITA
ncbi:hypothetical protein [Roseibium sp.]|uniref:hypothetical protein n=1 Tax=Roseibium sp. TaxID=1936156 RepID=UPI003A96D79C